MSLLTTLRSTATNLINNYGEAVSFSRVVEGAYVPESGNVSSGTTTTYSGLGVPSQYTTQETDGDLVLATDIKLIMTSATLPLVGDVCTINSVAHRIMSVRDIRVQGGSCCYIAQLRI